MNYFRLKKLILKSLDGNASGIWNINAINEGGIYLTNIPNDVTKIDPFAGNEDVATMYRI